MTINHVVVGMVAIPVLGVVALLCWPAAQGSRSPRAIAGQRLPARDEEVAELTKEVENLRGQMGTLAIGHAALSARLQGSAPSASAPPKPGLAPEPPEATESFEELREKQTQAALKKIQTMESSFAAEPVEWQWATGAANDIREKITLTGAVVGDVQCATTLCRFSVSPKDGEQAAGAVGAVLHQLPWESEVFFHFNEKEPGRASIYLARAGNSLPKLQ